MLNTTSIQTNSIANIENNLNTTTTMLKESISENFFIQNNQNQLGNQLENNDIIKLNQTQTTPIQSNQT